jgi:lipopolysaccharide/colanic/teichoic acid biosynthesis glycosyltransferase
MKSIVLLKKTQIINLPSESQDSEGSLPPCSLKWRQKVLWVKVRKDTKSSLFPMIENEQWLVDCLRHSLAEKVSLSPELGEAGVSFWASACQQSDKKVFLRISSGFKFEKGDSFSWALKRAFDWLAAVLLLLVLSPVLLVLACSIRITSPGPLFFRQWRVGKGGQLFQILKFRSMEVDADKKHHQVMGEQEGLHKCKEDPRVTPLGRWMRRYSLDELPQLINVLRGELSLVGPRPWALYDALRLSSPAKKRLKALPGITGVWPVMGRSQLLDLEVVSQSDLEYLEDWSLWKDLVILLLTVLKVLSGSEAY